MHKPSRQVRSNGITTVGYRHSSKCESMVQIESSLERKFLTLLEFDPNVIRYSDQPVKILYKDELGNSRSYTPDFLVDYRHRKSVYYEVKYESYLKANQKEVKRKFDAARQFAKECSCEFKVFKDTQINSVYQENVEFLLGYVSQSIESETEDIIVRELRKVKTSTPANLIRLVSDCLENESKLIRPLWILIANRVIGCNLFATLEMNSPIWLVTKNRSFKQLSYPYHYA
jgi:hypothetical protein